MSDKISEEALRRALLNMDPIAKDLLVDMSVYGFCITMFDKDGKRTRVDPASAIIPDTRNGSGPKPR